MRPLAIYCRKIMAGTAVPALTSQSLAASKYSDCTMLVRAHCAKFFFFNKNYLAIPCNILEKYSFSKLITSLVHKTT